MNTTDILQIGLRIFFFLTTFFALRHGDLFGIVLSLTVFLLMEYFVDELQQNTQVNDIRKTPNIE